MRAWWEPNLDEGGDFIPILARLDWFFNSSLATREPSSDTIGALILSGLEGRVECVSSNPVTLLIPQSPGSHQQIFHWCYVIQLSHLVLF